MTRPLSHIERVAMEQALSGLLSENSGESTEAGRRLVSSAKEHGLGVRDYLTLAIDPSMSEDAGRYTGLNGYEAAKAYLGLPTRDDYAEGIMLNAASETFKTFPGARAMFPEVMDDIVRWKYRPNEFERIDNLVANSRSISGTEMITTVVNDDEDDYKAMKAIAEGSRIPVYSIEASENVVKMFKHGMGYRTTYEFERRARLDLITPYANRALRQAEISKVRAATDLLVNGDSVHSAANVTAQSSFNTVTGDTATNGKISYKHLMAWLVDRAKAGFPVDTVVGNYDAYVQWLLMFAVPTSQDGETEAQSLARSGFQIGGVPLMNGTVDFVLSSNAPANKLIGFSRGDTLEELVEIDGLISESEQSIRNQTVTYVRTETTGYRLVFGDTRDIYNFGG